MGFRTIAICVLLVTTFSCSKPAQENTYSSDSTATGTTEPTVNTDAGGDRTPVQLSTEQAERVSMELFKYLHQYFASYGVALTEEFKNNGTGFEYTLVRHNLNMEGLETNSYDGSRYATEEEEKAADWDTTQGPMPVAYTEVHQWYTSQIDTLLVKGTYHPFVEGEPESTLITITCSVDATIVHKNDNTVKDGQVTFRSSTKSMGEGESEFEEPVFTVDFGTPLQFKQDELYLKAKITDLADSDIANLSKDELSFVRNDIFAHHGHTFKTAKMIDHYSKTDWYHAVAPDAALLLNKSEKRNVDFIKKREG